MLHENDSVSNEALRKIKVMCRVFSAVFRVVYAIIIIWWAVALFSLVCSLLSPDLFESSETTCVLAVAIFFLLGIDLFAFFAVLSNMFSGLANGDIPFSNKQVESLRVLALLLAIYFGLETVSSSISVLLHQSGFHTGFFTTGAEVNSFVTIDPAPLLIAAVFFALSFVFEYGVLLQGEANDTV